MVVIFTHPTLVEWGIKERGEMNPICFWCHKPTEKWKQTRNGKKKNTCLACLKERLRIKRQQKTAK